MLLHASEIYMPHFRNLSPSGLGNFCVWGVFLGLCPSALYALPFATGRAGGGYSYLGGDKGASSSTNIVSGTGRFGYLLDNRKWFFAIDATAYRLHSNKALVVNQDGNSALAVVGYELESMSFWLAAGAGEIRSYDRTAERARPNGYYSHEQACGYNLQLYSADYARVEVGTSLNRITPDADWQTKTGIRTINSIQIDIGFKLFNW